MKKTRNSILNDPGFLFEACKNQLAVDVHQALDNEGLTQSKLGDAMGKSRQFVSEFLSEPYNPSLKALSEIAASLDRQLVVRILEPGQSLVPVPRNKLSAVRDFVAFDIPFTPAPAAKATPARRVSRLTKGKNAPVARARGRNGKD